MSNQDILSPSQVFHDNKCIFFVGYKVITFKNPYLGNTCVPFQHWACSQICAQNIEIPARHEQIAAARELDRQYDSYIKECQKQYNSRYLPPHRDDYVHSSMSELSEASLANNCSTEDISSVNSSCIGYPKHCHCVIS